MKYPLSISVSLCTSYEGRGGNKTLSLKDLQSIREDKQYVIIIQLYYEGISRPEIGFLDLKECIIAINMFFPITYYCPRLTVLQSHSNRSSLNQKT